MNTNSPEILAMLRQLEYILDYAVKQAIANDNPPAILQLLNTESIGHNGLMDKNLPEYLGLAVAQGRVRALETILTYNPINPEHVLDLNHFITVTNEEINQVISVESRYTLLNYAIDYITDEDTTLHIARLLLEAGANPNIPCHAGYTPLHNAALRKNPNLVTLLLTHHANPNMLTNTTEHYSCLESLLLDLLKISPDDRFLEEDDDDDEMRLLDCTSIFLLYHAEVRLNFYEYGNMLGFTHVLTLLEETKRYPLHIAATYFAKQPMIEKLMNSSFEDFELLDAHGNKPSDIAKKYGQEDLIEILEKYEAVYQRRQLLETNYENSGAGLPTSINITRVNIASYLTAHEFGMFTATANMHIHPNDKDIEAVEHEMMTTPNI